MFKKLLAALGVKLKSPSDAPYRTAELNSVHRMLFADEAGTLFGEAPDANVVQAIAQDAAEESRVRLLAAHWLRTNGHVPATPQLLGVVVEVPLEEGMDTLAAYADGRVRYINHTNRVAVFEGAPAEMAGQAQVLVATAIAAAAKAGEATTSAMPRMGQVRFTFLCQDGNRAAVGYFTAIARDELAAPVLQQAQKLLDLVVRQGYAQ